jgi:ubiquinone/menaquinone biosynthesis C-methylase UbiE
MMGEITKESYANISLEELEAMRRKGYEEGATVYDTRRFVDPSGRLYAEIENILLDDLIEPAARRSILDVSTGTGRIALHLASRGHRVLGVDQAENMIQVAREKARRMALDNVSFEVANSRALPFKDDSFDYVTSIRFMHLIPRRMWSHYIGEMTRVLKPGGCLVIEFNNYWEGLLYGRIEDAYFNLFRNLPGRGRIRPSWIADAFPGLQVERKVGLWIRGLGRIGRVSKPMAIGLTSLGKYYPFHYLTSQILIKLRKYDFPLQ